eukprot:6103033-Prymnesium_polylepis.1
MCPRHAAARQNSQSIENCKRVEAVRLFLRNSICAKADRDPEGSPAMRLATSAAVRGRISGWDAGCPPTL